MSKDYYKTLGVEKNASDEEIKAAFRKLAHQHHPDKTGGSEAKFKEINEAYQVLGNKEKRQQYDQFGADFNQQGGFGQGMGWEDFMRAARGGQGGGFGNMNFDFGGIDLGDIFGDMFGGGRSARGARGGRRERGADIQMDITLEFEEAVFGATKIVELYLDSACRHCHGNGAEPGAKINDCSACHGSGQITQAQRTFFGVFQTQAVCSSCEGRGKVPEKKCSICHGQGIVKEKNNIEIQIPAGIDNGAGIRLSGKGPAGRGGSGDLYVNVRVKPSKEFERRGDDILVKIKISFKQAALGDAVEIKTMDGVVDLKIPAGTQPNTRFRLKGKGVPMLNSSGRGDMYVDVEVDVPTKLSRQQREALERF